MDTSALESLWSLHAILGREEEPRQRHWDALFATPALRHVVDGASARARTRRWIHAAFKPSESEAREALRAASGLAAVLFERFVRAGQSKAKIEAFLTDLAERGVLRQAMELVGGHLPPGAMSFEDPPPVRFAVFAPDAYAGNHELIVDVLLAMDLEDGLPLVAAHELHHCYYEKLRGFEPLPTEDPHERVVHTLRQLHLEGVADRIDKVQHPIRVTPGFPPAYAPKYNRHYLETPGTLERFDALLARIPEEPQRAAELAREAWHLFHFGAHPEGFFMAQRIVEAYGPEALLADMGDAFAFLRRYRLACVELGHPEPFSERSQEFLAELEVRVRAR